MTKFEPVLNESGNIDRDATESEFEDYVGGWKRAELLFSIWNKVPQNKDKKYRESTFADAAKQRGFEQEEVDAFLMIQ